MINYNKLQFITGSLPKFEHQHALVSSQLLGEIELIEDSKEKNQAYQYLSVALKDAFPILKESAKQLTIEIAQLKFSVSTQRDTVDIHRAKILKQVNLIKDSSNDEDADLNAPVEELQGTLSTLQEEYATLESTYKQDLTKLDVFSNRLSILIKETTLWEGTSQTNKTAINQ